LLHIYKSNGVMFEWLNSPMIYYDINTFQKDCLDLSSTYFRPKPTIYHYIGLAKRTFLDIEKEDEVKIKRYFYVLRPILAARYIADKNKIPPMDNYSLLSGCEGNVETIRTSINFILKEKEIREESYKITRIPEIDGFVKNEIEELSNIAVNTLDSKTPPDSLNEYLYETVKKNDR